jgi:hypothetical protein
MRRLILGGGRIQASTNCKAINNDGLFILRVQQNEEEVKRYMLEEDLSETDRSLQLLAKKGEFNQ